MGLHRARCCWVIDLGSVENKMYGKIQSKVMLGWELLDQSITVNDKPMRPIFKHKYTASLDSRAVLRQHLDSWRGVPFTDEELKKTGFELKNVLGACCYLQIMHEKGSDGTVYANLKSVMPLPPGSPECPPLMTRQVFFDMDEKTPVPDGLPPWLLAEIAKSPEWSTNYAGDGDGYQSNGAPEMTGLQAAMLEAEARGLAAACALPAQRAADAIAHAVAKGTLRELVQLYRMQLEGLSAPPVTPPAPPATAALPPLAPDLEADLYDLGEVLGYTVRETREAIHAAQAAGQVAQLADTWKAKAKQGAA
jgi:hypothetical protein